MDSDRQRQAIRELALTRGDSLTALSRMLGRNGSYLQQYIERRSPRWLGDPERQLLAAHFGVSVAALGGATESADMVAVPWRDVTASAGAGGVAEDDRVLRVETLPVALLRRLGIAPGRASLIGARGDSMAPGIIDGDRLLVDEAQVRLPRAGGIYVLRRAGLLAVKRLHLAAGMLTVASDNPAYPTETVPTREATILGRVRLLLREPL